MKSSFKMCTYNLCLNLSFFLLGFNFILRLLCILKSQFSYKIPRFFTHILLLPIHHHHKIVIFPTIQVTSMVDNYFIFQYQVMRGTWGWSSDRGLYGVGIFGLVALDLGFGFGQRWLRFQKPNGLLVKKNYFLYFF